MDRFKLKTIIEHPDAKPPVKAYSNENSAGFDLTSIEDVTVKAYGTAIVPIGIRVIIPKTLWGHFCGRSSLGYNKCIEPYSCGVLDPTYSGNLDVRVYNRSEKDYTIKKGDRFCQLMLHRVLDVEVEILSTEEFAKEEASIKAEGGRASELKWGSSGR